MNASLALTNPWLDGPSPNTCPFEFFSSAFRDREISPRTSHARTPIYRLAPKRRSVARLPRFSSSSKPTFPRARKISFPSRPCYFQSALRTSREMNLSLRRGLFLFYRGDHFLFIALGRNHIVIFNYSLALFLHFVSPLFSVARRSTSDGSNVGVEFPEIRGRVARPEKVRKQTCNEKRGDLARSRRAILSSSSETYSRGE